MYFYFYILMVAGVGLEPELLEKALPKSCWSLLDILKPLITVVVVFQTLRKLPQ